MTDPLADHLAQLDLDSASTDLDDVVLETLSTAEGGYLPLELVVDAVASRVRGPSATDQARSAVAATLKPPGDDGRRRPACRLVAVAGAAYLVLTSSGWTLLGQTNKREARPTKQRVTHSLAVHNVTRWLRDVHAPALARRDIEARVDHTAAVASTYRSHRESLRMLRPNDHDSALLVGGLFPDLVLRTNWPSDQLERRTKLWPGCDPTLGSDMACAVEIELSSKAAVGVTDKLRRHAAALHYGWHHAVLWVVTDPRTLDLLRRSAREANVEETVRYIVQAGHVGHGTPTAALGDGHWPEGAWAHGTP